MTIVKDPAVLHISIDSEEAIYLLWILENGLPNNKHNRVMVIRDRLAKLLIDVGIKEYSSI